MEKPLDKLNERHHQYIDKLLSTAPWQPIEAYVYAFECQRQSAESRAYVLMRDPLIVAEIERRQAELRKNAGMTAAQVLDELRDLATADPRDLSEYHIGSCRFCHGIDHKYQRTPAEYERDLATYLEENGRLSKARLAEPDPLGMHFQVKGGVGFNMTKAPHAQCPECFGLGVGYDVFKDTRTLSAKAKRLYGGIKRTRDGLEIKTRNQDKALELQGQHLGLFKQSLELSGPGGAAIPMDTKLSIDPVEAGAAYRKLIQG